MNKNKPTILDKINEYKENPQPSEKWKLLKEISKYKNRNKMYEKAMGPSRHGEYLKKQRMAQRMKEHLANPQINSCALATRSTMMKGTLQDVVNRINMLDSEVNIFISMNQETKENEYQSRSPQIE